MKHPAGACDRHMHIYDHRFPVAPNAKLGPPDATVDDYRLLQKRLGLTRSVVGTPSTYGTDNSDHARAPSRHSAPAARGVAVVSERVSDAELKRLDGLGVTGIRFNLVQAGATTIGDARTAVAAAVDALGWHVQIHVLADQILTRFAFSPHPRINAAGLLDHLAHTPHPDGVKHSALRRIRASAARQGPHVGEAVRGLHRFQGRRANLR